MRILETKLFSPLFILFSLAYSPMAYADVWTFETPSENIQCTVGQGHSSSDLTCTIIERSGDYAIPKPTDCNSDWGHTFLMYDTGPVAVLCEKTSDLKEGFDRAEYGVTGKFSGFTCLSSQKGFECLNRDGNGFFLSRKKQTVIGKSADNTQEIEQRLFEWTGAKDGAHWQARKIEEEIILAVECPLEPSQNTKFGLIFDIVGYETNGDATFIVDGGEIHEFRFSFTKFEANFPWDAENILKLVADLKGGKLLEINTADGRRFDVNLEGSSKALENCKAKNAATVDEQIIQESSVPEPTDDDANKVIAKQHFDAEDLLTSDVNGVNYHQIKYCGFERGVAIARYSFRTKNDRDPVFEITDVCFDREGGALLASESEDDLTLVRRDTADENSSMGFDYFEVLSPGVVNYNRWRATAGQYDDYDYADVAIFSYDRPTSEVIGWKTTGTRYDADVSLNGYVMESSKSQQLSASAYYLYVGGADYIDYKRGNIPEFSGREAPIVSWEGPAVVSNNELTATLRSQSNEFSVGEGQLELSVDANGNVSGSGVLKAKNARLAGVNDFDWKTTEWRILALVGHITGENGRILRAVAIARGETIDYDGFVNPVYATIDVSGYSKETVERWGDARIIQDLNDAILHFDPQHRNVSENSADLQAEQHLDALGFTPGEIDGVFDADTSSAILAFQERLRLSPTATLTSEQRDLLKAWAVARAGQKQN